MECVKCGSPLGRDDYCPACGADVRIYKKIIFASNRCYNDGLERARVRDLSGAIESLRKSLQYSKMNIKARNLLGLVYFEMGETVDALSEWVISRSLQPNNNSAERYLAAVQSNKNKLEALNQTIKKYNQVLIYCKQGSLDLATIQLKKILGTNPHFVKGHQLLALIYMEDCQYELAKKTLREAAHIDMNNTITMRYLKEVNAHLRSDSEQKKAKKAKDEPIAYQSGNDTIIHPTHYKESKSNALSTVLNILLGAVIGGLIVVFLIFPSIQQQAVREASDTVREANETISAKNQEIKGLEDEAAALETQIAQLQEGQSNHEEVLANYGQLLSACGAFLRNNIEGASAALEKVDASSLSGEASTLYQSLNERTDEEYIVTSYHEGKSAYDAGNYEEAAEKLQKVIDIDETYDSSYAIYYLAQSYRSLEQFDKAAIYYQKVIDQIPGTKRAQSAQRFLEEMDSAMPE